MAAVIVFGYTIPLTVLLVLLALVVGLLLAISLFLTTGLSVYRSVQQTRRDRVRPDLRDGLFDRLFADDPDWAEWVSDMSQVERSVVESLLDEHVRELEGADAERLAGLGDALGIPDRASRRLESGDEYERLGALTWLTLLRRPEPYVQSDFEPRTPRERAGAVTLLEATDRLPDAETGVAMLLDGVDEQFSVFGQDTLYRVSRDDPEPLLGTASREHGHWPEPLLAQVLAVCAHLETSVREGNLVWLTAALENDQPAIRAAAAAALGSFGWRRSIRERPFLERAIDDPSPRVRAAVYRMLGAWGDQRALSVLLFALVEEDDPRALTVGTTALVNRQDRIDTDAASVLGDAWTWSAEHAAYDRLARTPNSAGVGG